MTKAKEPRTVMVMGQEIYICARCDQPILTTGVLTSGRAVHVPSCPVRRSP